MAQLGRDTEATRFDTGRVAFLLSSALPGIGIRAVGFDDLPQINQRNLHKSGQHKLGIRSQVDFSEVPQAVLEAAGKTRIADDMTVLALRLAR